MKIYIGTKRVVALALAVTLSIQTVSADQVRIPFDTRIYVETQEEVIGSKKRNPEGSTVRASVWRDVIVDGNVVIKRGTPVLVRVDSLKGPKIAGVKGKITLGAYETNLVNGEPIQLDGGYFKGGKGRIALSATLAGLVFLPLIFIPGKKAKLPEGTVFDATTDAEMTFNLPAAGGRKINLSRQTDQVLMVEVLYDELERRDAPTSIPFKITVPDGAAHDFKITKFNGVDAKPLFLEATKIDEVSGKHIFQAEGDLKELSKNLRQGINTLTVSAVVAEASAEQELVLDIQF